MIAAAIQLFSTPLQPERNLLAAERLVRQAASRGARVIVLPELFNTGYVYSPALFRWVEHDDGPTLRWLAGLSAGLGVHLAGSLLLREGDHLFNSLVLAEPSGKTHRYHKQHPFLWEHCYFEPGRGPLVVETDLGRVGLMVCWDIAHRAVWESYRGKVDLMLIASSPARLHRAVLNFPLGKKVYLAELVPSLLADRGEIDRWYSEDLGERAAWLGAPIVHSVMSGRFVAQVPYPRLSFLAGALARPRLLPLVAQAHLASLRSTFWGSSAVFSAAGEPLAQVTAETGIALADTRAAPLPASPPPPRSDSPLLRAPARIRSLQWLLKRAGGVYRRQHAVQ